MKALIADDSSTMRKIVRLNLMRLDVDDVLEASNGKEALALIIAHPDLDLLFLDINMPLVNGFQIAQACQTKNLLHHGVMIGISDDLSPKNRKTFENIGVKHFVGKPFNLAEFNATVEPLVQQFMRTSPPQLTQVSPAPLVNTLSTHLRDFFSSTTQFTITTNEDTLAISTPETTVIFNFDKLVEAFVLKDQS